MPKTTILKIYQYKCQIFIIYRSGPNPTDLLKNNNKLLSVKNLKRNYLIMFYYHF